MKRRSFLAAILAAPALPATTPPPTVIRPPEPVVVNLRGPTITQRTAYNYYVEGVAARSGHVPDVIYGRVV